MVRDNSNTCITVIEERFTALMKKMFAEELEKQHQTLLKLISGNFEITMKETKNIKYEANELKKSIEFTDAFFEEKVQKTQGKVYSFEEKIDEI